MGLIALALKLDFLGAPKPREEASRQTVIFKGGGKL
jgi:hypothetical protein